MLRNKRITASKLGQVAKRQSNFDNLVRQINPSRHVVTAPMLRGLIIIIIIIIIILYLYT